MGKGSLGARIAHAIPSLFGIAGLRLSQRGRIRRSIVCGRSESHGGSKERPVHATEYDLPMPRYAAFLRGISPVNAKMSDLTRCFEAAGFTNVRTVLSSGNLVFDARAAPEGSIERRAEGAMTEHLGRSFFTIVRSLEALRALLASDPYDAFRLAPNAKRVVTFFREKAASKVTLPIERDGARILTMRGREVFTSYVPSPRGPVFMSLIEKTFGESVTTRTWETVTKVSR